MSLEWYPLAYLNFLNSSLNPQYPTKLLAVAKLCDVIKLSRKLPFLSSFNIKSFEVSVTLRDPGFIDSPTLKYGIVKLDADKNKRFSIVFLFDAPKLFAGSYGNL